MAEKKTFSSLAQKKKPQIVKPVHHQPKRESLWKKLAPGIMIVTISVLVSGSIPFVKAHYDKQEQVNVSQREAEQLPKTDTTSLDPFVWTTRLKIEDIKLHHRLSVAARTDNRIEVSGRISPQEVDGWEKFLAWYDTKEGFPALHHTVTADAVSGNIPELKSVWFHDDPVAYFQDGTFGSAGSILQDGWTIKNIEAWAVLIERDGAMVSLSYH